MWLLFYNNNYIKMNDSTSLRITINTLYNCFFGML